VSRNTRSLWPREHGAYAQLGVPLATAVALRAPTPSSILLTTAACAAFLANEPLLVVLGHRGPRMRRNDGCRASWRLGVLAGIAILAGIAGLLPATGATLAVAGMAALPALAMLALACTRSERTLVGELVAAVALPGAAAPVAVASGVAVTQALLIWTGWAIGFALVVAAVHRVIACHRRARTRLDDALVAGFAATTLASAGLGFELALAWVPLPLAATAAVLALHPPPATRLRAIGVALVIASLASGAVVIAFG
jgi:hypothetical protein